MSTITGLTRGGVEWTPAFVTALDQKHCIGCGRCFKVCPRDVFELIERGEDMALEADDDFDDDDDDMYGDDDDDDMYGDDDDDDGFSDEAAMVMSLKNSMDCIGCEACSRVCPKDCMTHEPAAAA
ncbi:ferredoxin III, nif-specific [Magnetospira thiophila]